MWQGAKTIVSVVRHEKVDPPNESIFLEIITQ
jgi:hypothetical protein